jgi:hypothetical protein
MADNISKNTDTTGTIEKKLSSEVDNNTYNWQALEQNFYKRCAQMDLLLKNWIDDIQAIDIVTATADSDGLKATIDTARATLLEGLPETIQIRARTTMQLDGDYIDIVPTKNNSASPDSILIDNEILTIHKENIKSALNNFSTNIKILTDGMVHLISSLKDNGIKVNK